MVHDLCGLLERVGDQRITQRRLDRLGRSADSGIRVWIEGFKLAGATLEPKENEGFWGFPTSRGFGYRLGQCSPKRSRTDSCYRGSFQQVPSERLRTCEKQVSVRFTGGLKLR